MKSVFLMGFLVLFTFLAHATNAPFSPEEDARFAALEPNVSHTVKATYDFSTMGGAISTISLGKSLPAKSLIKQAWFYVDTTPTSGGTPGVKFTCEDTGNILASTDVTTWSAGQIKSGVETGAASTMVAAIAAQCNISIEIATAALTAGKIEVFVEYVLTN